MTPTTVTINRAPVLTLWAAVVAKRLGFTWPEALSLGKALAGLNAQSKGRRLGIFRPHEQKPTNARETPHAKEFFIELCGRPVPAKNTPKGIRAMKGEQVVTPESAMAYLEGKFGQSLEPAWAVMEALARAYKPQELALEAFGLYSKFRPIVPDGVKGWGAKGVLELEHVRKMAGRVYLVPVGTSPGSVSTARLRESAAFAHRDDLFVARTSRISRTAAVREGPLRPSGRWSRVPTSPPVQ